MFYFELMISKDDHCSLVPISLGYGEATDDSLNENFIFKSWLNRIRFDHEHLLKSSSDSLSTCYVFPRPSIILVDDHRETSLNNSIVEFFNNESFCEVR